MKTKELIEKLENLATFFTLQSKDAKNGIKDSKSIRATESASFHEGRKTAYDTAFSKINTIIKEAKR